MRKAIELDDRHARALNYVGYTLAESKKNLDEAERLIRRALAVEPYSGYILDSLGWVYYQRGQFEQAFTYLKRATVSGEEDPVIFEHLGDTAMKLGRYQEAVKAYEKALNHRKAKKEPLLKKLKEAHRLSGTP
jgi:Tfp pilus assembly protein PilF